MSQPIWYDSTEAGAPTLNNVAGSLLEVLRACLINGFNAKPVTSIAVASGVATATCAAHGFLGTYGKLVQISGATESLLNGNKQPGGVLTNSFTFPAPGVADGTYTGSISARRAPLGWTEPHTSGNVSIFARTSVEATAGMLRVNDSHAAGSTANDARVFQVSSATGVDAFTGRAPTETQMAGGGFWSKGHDTVTAKPWALVGDGRFFWLITPTIGNVTIGAYNYGAFYFGDGVPYVTPDPYFCILASAPSTYTGGNYGTEGGVVRTLGATLSSYGASVLRSVDSATESQRFSAVGPSVGSSGAIGSTTDGQVSTANVVIHAPIWVLTEGVDKTIRGEVPGLAAPLSRAPFSAMPQFSVIDTVAGSGRKYLSVLHTCATNLQGNLLIDLTGPWY